MNPFTHALLASNNDSIIVGESPAFSVSQTSVATLFWPMIYKSSEWPELTTTKDYFLLYSTDHAQQQGAIWWGEFDDFNGNTLNGFIERGAVIETGVEIAENEPETPFLIRGTKAETGFDDKILLYFHHWTTPGDQETRLLTTSGGLLHTATWTDRGKPIPLLAGDDHTGYLRIWKRGPNDYIGHALYDGLLPVTSGAVYVATNPSSFTRLTTFSKDDLLEGWERSTLQAFYRNSKLYGIFLYYAADGLNYIGLAELNTATYIPTALIKTLHQSNIRTLKTYFEGDIAYILFKNGNPGDVDNVEPFYMVKYDLTELD